MFSPFLFVSRFLKALPCFYVLLVLFGAPLFSDITASLILSALLSLLTVFPICCVFTDELQLADFFVFEKYGTAGEFRVRFACFSTLIGCWLGAFVIPLDWDRWWQRYPVPNLCGTVAGFLLGYLAADICRIVRQRYAAKKAAQD